MPHNVETVWHPNYTQTLVIHKYPHAQSHLIKCGLREVIDTPTLSVTVFMHSVADTGW